MYRSYRVLFFIFDNYSQKGMSILFREDALLLLYKAITIFCTVRLVSFLSLSCFQNPIYSNINCFLGKSVVLFLMLFLFLSFRQPIINSLFRMGFIFFFLNKTNFSIYQFLKLLFFLILCNYKIVEVWSSSKKLHIKVSFFSISFYNY